MKILLVSLIALWAATGIARAEWTAVDGDNTGAPGRKVEIRAAGELVAAFIHGEGQMKPFLHLFGSEGDGLTEWAADQQFPHHRGFFIGWNEITSELGTSDLWHMRGGRMAVAKLEKIEAERDRATLVATIEWRGGKADSAGSDLLLTETRALMISRSAPERTQVDVSFVLRAARDLTLGGDLQHAGVHFRGTKELASRKNQTNYLWEPDLPGKGGKVQSPDLKWAQLTFPVGPRWYSATLLNAPDNPVEQLSWRDYGRFGFFFARAMNKGESLTLHYRLLTEREEQSDGERKVERRAAAQARHQEFVRALKEN